MLAIIASTIPELFWLSSCAGSPLLGGLATLCASGLVCGSFCVLAAAFLGPLQSLLLYGKTRLGSNSSCCVPKSWFTHFYVIHSFLASLLLVYACFCGSISSTNALFVLLNALQAWRRLYECLVVSKWGQGHIHATHYLAGAYFYSSINVVGLFAISKASTMGSAGSAAGSSGSGLSWLCLLAALAFLLASCDQYLNHLHLSTLRKYSLPTRGLFRYAVCAHYLDEVAIYCALWALAGGGWIYGSVVFWVLVNLTVSSRQSYLFYQKKELLPQNQKLWCIIPFVY